MIASEGTFLCAGNLVQDILVRPVERVAFDATSWVESIEQHLGGNGSNTSYGLAKLGAPVRLLGQVGDDDFGRRVMAKLREAGVDCTAVVTGEAATACTVVLVKPDGSRAFLHCPGASLAAFAEPIVFGAGYNHFHLANLYSLPRMRQHAAANVENAHFAGLTTSMDTGWDSRGEWMTVLKPCLPHVDLLFVNHSESRWLTGHEDPRGAAKVFRELGARTVIVKLGARGCALFGDGLDETVPGFSVNVVDTTGAGDCFAAGFLTALYRGMDIVQAARFANAVGALGVQKLGGVEGLRTYDETLAWMAEQPA